MKLGKAVEIWIGGTGTGDIFADLHHFLNMLKAVSSYLRSKPWLSAGTLLLIITWGCEKFALKDMEEYFENYRDQTQEYFHTMHLMNAAQSDLYLIDSHKEKFLDVNGYSVARVKALAELGQAYNNHFYQLNRRGWTPEESKGKYLELTKANTRIALYVRDHAFNQLEAYVDSLSTQFSISFASDNQIVPVEKTFRQWFRHILWNKYFFLISTCCYIFGSIMIAYHSYLEHTHHEQEEVMKKKEYLAAIHHRIEALKRQIQQRNK